MDYIIDLNVMKVEIQDLKNIQKNEVTLVKNFISLTREYDFNLLSTLMEENECVITQKSNIGNLKDIFEMRSVSDSLNEFKIFYDFLSKLFKYERDSKDEINLFFSFVSQVGGSHADKEDVFIGSENKDYCIKKGDMVFIPKGIKHKVIGLNPRIVASIGFFGKRK